MTCTDGAVSEAAKLSLRWLADKMNAMQSRMKVVNDLITKKRNGVALSQQKPDIGISQACLLVLPMFDTQEVFVEFQARVVALQPLYQNC